MTRSALLCLVLVCSAGSALADPPVSVQYTSGGGAPNPNPTFTGVPGTTDNYYIGSCQFWMKLPTGVDKFDRVDVIVLEDITGAGHFAEVGRFENITLGETSRRGGVDTWQVGGFTDLPVTTKMVTADASVKLNIKASYTKENVKKTVELTPSLTATVPPRRPE